VVFGTLLLMADVAIRYHNGVSRETRRPNRTLSCTTATCDRAPIKNVTADCGISPSEARDRGCIFDIMRYAWTPPECYYGDASTEFWETIKAAGHGKWFTDTSGNETITADSDADLIEKLSNMRTGYTTNAYHAAHCILTSRIYRQALATGQVVPEDIPDYGHSLHCEEILFSALDYSEATAEHRLSTIAYMGFRPCVAVE
jgi:hypothetical protein